MDALDVLQAQLERAERAARIAIETRSELIELLDDVLNSRGPETPAERLDRIRAAVMALLPDTTGFLPIANHIESLESLVAIAQAARDRRQERDRSYGYGSTDYDHMGNCEAGWDARGITSCILCGKELRERDGRWYTHDGEGPLGYVDISAPARS